MDSSKLPLQFAQEDYSCRLPNPYLIFTERAIAYILQISSHTPGSMGRPSLRFSLRRRRVFSPG